MAGMAGYEPIDRTLLSFRESGMSLPASAVLQLLHILYFLYSRFFHSYLQLLYEKEPGELICDRRQTPEHITLVFKPSEDRKFDDSTECLVENISRAVKWSQIAGIRSLSVYIRDGHIKKISDELCLRSDGAIRNIQRTSGNTDKFLKYHIASQEVPGTIQENQHAEHFGVLDIRFLSYEASKLQLAKISRQLAASRLKLKDGHGWRESLLDRVNVDQLQHIIHDSLPYDTPDLLVIHDTRGGVDTCLAMELHGFPPWHMRLSEIYRSECSFSSLFQRGKKPAYLSERTFRRALDEYAAAEMRVGA